MTDNTQDTAFKNINYNNKTVSVPLPTRMKEIDTDHDFYNNIIDASQNGIVDLNSINNFTNISRSRDTIYDLLDLMCEDPIIASAVEIYTSDACETNDNGNIMWCESDDPACLTTVNMLLNSLNIDKNSHNWVYNLVKYGDIYLRLYRQSEYDPVVDKKKEDNKLNEDLLNEDIILKIFSKNDRYAEYMELVKNPAEVFDLQRFGKSYGYLRTHINHTKNLQNDILDTYNQSQFMYKFKKNDVDVFPATEFVHACLDDDTDRIEEEVIIGNDLEEDNPLTAKLTFKVRRGKSILYNSFKIWRELSLLENAVLLNRLTKSSIVRTVSVEVGDMEKSQVRNLMNRIKGMIEQKSSINTNASIKEYTNPGPMENVIYVPTHEGKGAITTSSIGGDVEVGNLDDLGYWKKKLFASIGIPGQYLGDTEDNTGFNGGTSLSLISSRYAKTIKHIQNVYIQAITDAINLMLLDRGLVKYINKFQLRMQAPTTQEEKDRKDNMNNTISIISSVMSLIEVIEDPITKLKILKTLLARAINNEDVISIIQEEIDKLEEQNAGGATVETGDDFGGGDLGGLGGDFGGDLGGDLGGDTGGSTEMDFGGDELPTGEEAGVETPPEESFYSNRGGKELLQEDNLPSWDDLGVSYNSI